MLDAKDVIPLRTVAPRPELIYRRFVVASLLIATLVGFVLAIHVPLGRLLASPPPDRTPELVQAHGQAQLLGFAGLYVMGMSLRLLPRFTHSKLAFEALIPVALWGMVGAVTLRSAVLPWLSEDVHAVLFVVSALGVLLASGCYLLIVVATIATAKHRDASGLALALSAAQLVVASVVNVVAVVDAVDRSATLLPYFANNAVLQLELSGFVLTAIMGVGLRALPTMAGRERPRRGARVLPVALAGSVLLLAAALMYLEYGSYSERVVRATGTALVLLGITLGAFAWQVGILRPVANRVRPSSQPHLWLIRSGVVWLAAVAALAIFTGAASFAGGDLPLPSEFDALRHALGTGVVVNLILGMSLMILPEFAAERQRSGSQRQIAYLLVILVNLAAVLRVAPSIEEARWTADGRDLSMAIAGSLAEAAMLIFAGYLLRLIWRTR